MDTINSPIMGFDIMSFLPIILIIAVFYFFIIRPQQKKAQEQKKMLSSLRRGDRIITNGGLIGVVTKVVNDQELEVEIADGVRVRTARAMIAELVSKTEPVRESSMLKSTKVVKKPAAKKSSRTAKAKK